jgi:nitrogen fixation-related uncharacterized protein
MCKLLVLWGLKSKDYGTNDRIAKMILIAKTSTFHIAYLGA